MAENLVVVSKVKKIVKDAGLRTGGDFIDTLSTKINQMITVAIQKVNSEGKKKTLGSEDI